MIRWLREFRLLPVVLVATASLLALKTLGLVLDGGYAFTLGGDDGSAAVPAVIDSAATADSGAATQSAAVTPETPPLAAPLVTAQASAAVDEKSWAQQMFNFPDVTGSIGATEPTSPSGAAKNVAAPPPKPAPGKPAPGKSAIAASPPKSDATAVRNISPAERAILERLQDRRKELDSRARELDMRETLIKAAEKRLEAKVAEVKQIEAHIDTTKTKQGEAEAARLKGLIAMYETMKPKDAAKIFDRLDMKVLVDVASRIKPRQMAEIMAQMSPEIAERLTVEFASRDPIRPDISRLPKIEGQPTAAN